MLTSLKFHNTNPSGIQKKFPEYPDAFIVYPNLEHEIFKDVKGISPDVPVIFVNPIEIGIYQGGFAFDITVNLCSDYNIQKIRGYSEMLVFDGKPVSFSTFTNISDYFKLGEKRSLYGVADDIEQIKEYFKPAIDNPNVNFVISITEINKRFQPSSDGWRWHKWGKYIGKQNPQCEYIHDEPEIEKVLVFQGYYLDKKPECGLLPDYTQFPSNGIYA